VFWARRALVEGQHWLTEREFVDLLALGQLLPGPKVLNLAALVGYRFAGWAGAIAACTGFMGWPFLVVIAMGALRQRYSALPLVQHALTGMSAVAAGLVLASGVKMASVLTTAVAPQFIGVSLVSAVEIVLEGR